MVNNDLLFTSGLIETSVLIGTKHRILNSDWLLRKSVPRARRKIHRNVLPSIFEKHIHHGQLTVTVHCVGRHDYVILFPAIIVMQ